jgi:hypothetical protein
LPSDSEYVSAALKRFEKAFLRHCQHLRLRQYCRYANQHWVNDREKGIRIAKPFRQLTVRDQPFSDRAIQLQLRLAPGTSDCRKKSQPPSSNLPLQFRAAGAESLQNASPKMPPPSGSTLAK